MKNLIFLIMLVLLAKTSYAGTVGPEKTMKLGQSIGVKGSNGEMFCPKFKQCDRNSESCNEKLNLASNTGSSAKGSTKGK